MLRDKATMHAVNGIDKRLGFTLIEVLIATTVALILMLGLSQVFKVLGDSITKGRAGLELNNRLRNVALRIRTDLDNLTVNDSSGPLQPPLPFGSGRGYLKYYDGPMTDNSLGAVDPSDNNIADGLAVNHGQTNPLLNRIGDLDDIFMGTVRAKDSWFTGKVPRFILEQRSPLIQNNGTLIDLDNNGVPDEFDDLVTIASEFAEVIVYAQPIPSSVGNPARDAAVGLSINPNSGTFEDSFSGISAATDNIPDSFRLHYRILLIRPDLNLANGFLPGYDDGRAHFRAMVAGPENLLPFGSNTTLPPQCDMYRVHQYCDLSIRRVYDFNPVTNDRVAANNLEDLAIPANRFAHIQHQVGNANSPYWSMPTLALGNALPFQQIDDTGYLAKSGFLHPAFSLMGERRGEDLLASDLVAFDVKAFDPACPLILDPASGMVLRPGDPGLIDPGIRGLTAAIQPVAVGDFVDVGWGDSYKLSIPNPPLDLLTQGRFVETPLSGVDFTAGGRVIDPELIKAGAFLSSDATNSARTLIFQPCYDTYTDRYESDGILQGSLLSPPAVGTVQWRAPNPPFTPDRGLDNLDNDGDTLVDEPDEKESSAPFVMGLRGIQISVRLEDPATKQFKQMSIVKSFVPAS